MLRDALLAYAVLGVHVAYKIVHPAAVLQSQKSIHTS